MSALSSVSGSMTGLNFSGLATGIDTEGIIEKLLSIRQSRVSTLQGRQAVFSQKQETFKALEAKVVEFQGTVGRLARSFGGAFDGRKATSSDETALKAAAGSASVPGVYTLRVDKLATAHQVASVGLTDPNAALKTGTLTLKVGTGEATTITVDSTNDTLTGLAAAINNAGGDVVASVINDGSSAPHRLMLSSKKTGTANAIAVTNNLSAGGGAALNLDPVTQTIQAAGDATVKLGSDATAITVNSATNKVDNLIPGVSLDLLKADPTKSLSLTISNDTGSAKEAVQDFVDSYNAVMDFIDERDDFDNQANSVGVLVASRDAADVESELARAVGSVVAGVNGKMNRLSAAGVTFTDTGRLELDSGKLDAALNGQVAGVTLQDVKRLFALGGNTTNPGVSFVVGSSKTKAASNAPIGVNITQVAAGARLAGSSDVAGSVVIDSTNRDLSLTVNGKTANLQLAAGTYDPASLTAELAAKVAASADLVGAQVNVSLQGGKVNVSADGYGSASKVTMNSGTALASLGFTAGATASGTDVAGYFVVDGKTEAATGSGQLLFGSAGNANTDGLQVRVTLAESQLNGDAGTPEAVLGLTRGLAAVTDDTLTRFADPVNGRFKTIDTGFQKNIDDVKGSVAKINAQMDEQRETLIRRFSAMEAAVSRLKTMGDTMMAQLAGLAAAR